MIPPARSFVNRSIILGFMVLVGYCLAKSIQYGSVLGFILALISLGAGIYFIYLLLNAREKMEQAEQENRL